MDLLVAPAFSVSDVAGNRDHPGRVGACDACCAAGGTGASADSCAAGGSAACACSAGCASNTDSAGRDPARDPRDRRERYARRGRERREARSPTGVDGHAGGAGGEVHASGRIADGPVPGQPGGQYCARRLPGASARDVNRPTAESAGRHGDAQTFDRGFEVIEYPHIRRQHIYEAAAATLKVLDVRTAPNLVVGYVMGSGDEVAPVIEQLGAKVEMLGPDALAWGDLSRYNTIVLGVRAYETPRRSSRQQQPAARVRAERRDGDRPVQPRDDSATRTARTPRKSATIASPTSTRPCRSSNRRIPCSPRRTG